MALAHASEDLSLIILHTTSGHNPKQLLSTINELLPNVAIIGCSGSGVVANHFVNETVRSIALTAITGNEFISEKVAALTAENSFELARSTAQALKKKNSSINMIMAFGPGIVVNGAEIIRGISDIFSDDVPILGGLAGFNGTEPKTPLFYNQEVLEQTIVMVGFYDHTLDVAQASHHGYLPQEKQKFTVTKLTGSFINELDGKPAWPTLMASFDLPPSTQPVEVISLLALGTDLSEAEQKAYDNKYKLRAPLLLSEDGNSFMMQSTVTLGSSLAWAKAMSKDSFTAFLGFTALL